MLRAPTLDMMPTPGSSDTHQTLVFTGQIIVARGGHAKLGVPGRQEVPDAPSDWPIRLFAGSLNVLIRHDGYPEELSCRVIPKTITFLDSGIFRPAFVIQQRLMQNNALNPQNTGVARGGEAQVWRGELHARQRRIHCWILRRIGSGLDREIEIVSSEGIRDSYDLPIPGPWPAALHLFGKWKV
jgi:hypothetical protein